MTVEQALNMIDAKRLTIFANQVIFNTWNEEEARWWAGKGAYLTEFYDPREVARAERVGMPVRQGWEVSIEKACDPIVVTKLNGEELDKTRETLLNEARRRKALLP